MSIPFLFAGTVQLKPRITRSPKDESVRCAGMNTDKKGDEEGEFYAVSACPVTLVRVRLRAGAAQWFLPY